MPDQDPAMEGTDRTEGTREQRFTGLFISSYGPVYSFVRRRLDADLAQDAVAETFVTAWRWFDELSGDPLPWLYRVARHAIANQRRGLTRRRLLEDRAQVADVVKPLPDHAEAVAESRALASAFGSLSERDREVLRLVTWDGLDAAAAAAVMGCSIAAFRVRLHRARRRFTKLLDANDRPPDHSTANIAGEEGM